MSLMFPVGLAIGEAFYDRVQERIDLEKNITHGIHTVLIAPRRFGKTSFIKKVLDETGIPHIWLDFMAITSREETQTKFLTHISDLIVKIAKTEDRLKELMVKYFSLFKPEISIGISGFLKVTFKPETISPAGITEALLNLDSLAQDVAIRLAIPVAIEF